MINKTIISLLTIALLLCAPSTEAMHQRKTTSPSSSSSTIVPTKAVSPYEQLEQLKLQKKNAKNILDQKKAEYYSNNRFGCLASENAQHCAGGPALAGMLSLLSDAVCPGIHGECESACNVPHGSIIACSLITALSSLACMLVCNTAAEKATAKELSDYSSIQGKVSQLAGEIHDAETERLKEHKRKIMKGE